MIEWPAKYVGIPFLSHGRDRDGCDCYGLLWLVYHEQFGVDLPLYVYGERGRKHIHELITLEATKWTPVDPGHAIPGDVVTIERQGLNAHVGVYVGGGKILHCDRGVGAVVEPWDSPRLMGHVGGVLRFSGLQARSLMPSDGVLATVRSNPFRDGHALTVQEPGLTISEILARSDIPAPYMPMLHVCLDGEPVAPEYWPRVKPKAGHSVEIVAIPDGDLANQLGVSTTTLRLLFSNVATLGGMAIGSMLIGGPVGYLVGTAIGIIGILLTNALIKPPEMPPEKLGFDLSGGRNLVSPYGPVPIVLGKMRVYPPLAALPYTEVIDDDLYLRQLFLVGKGPLDISDMKLGDTALESFEGVEVEVLRGSSDDPPLTLYDGNVIEDALSVALGQEHKNVWNLPEGEDSGEYSAAELGWAERTTGSNPDRISLDLTFPRGLLEMDDGDPKSASVQIEIQYKEEPMGEWIRINPFLDETIVSEGEAYLNQVNIFTWFSDLDGHMETITALESGMNSGDRHLPDAVLAQITHRLNVLSGRLVDVIADFTGPGDAANKAILAAYKANVDALGAALDDWGATDDPVAQAAQNLVNLTYANYEGGRSLLEVLWMDRKSKNYTAYVIRSPWWRRFSFARWFRLHNLWGITPPPWHTESGKYNGIRRITAHWPVESDSGLHDADTTYTVRVRRRSYKDEEENNITDDVVWTALRSHQDKAPINRDGVALVAIRIKASDQLSGAINNFNLMADGVIPVYDGTSGPPDYSAWPLSASRNPAWLYLSVLCGDANKRRVPISQVDLDAFVEWANWCDAGDLPWQFNAYITKTTTVFKLLQQIAAVGRARFGLKNGLYSIIRDVPQTIPVQHFTPRNSQGFRASRRLLEYPHALQCRFVNANAGYQEDEIYVYDDGFDSSNATKFESLDVAGITDAKRMHREARYHMACAQLRSEVIQIDVDAEHLICNVGDLVLVTHDVPMWGLAYGRVAGVSGTAITLDEAVPMETGGSYQIRFRLSDGTSVLRTVTTQAGLKTAITINSVVSGLAAGDLFMFGEAGSETRELIVQSISPGPDLTAKLQLVDHAPAVHTADTEEIPDYEPGVTVPPDIDLLRPPTPVIYSVVTDESVLERDVFGTLRSRILVNMRPPSLYSGPSPIFLESEFRATGDNRWIRLPILPAQSGNISIYNVQDRQTYDIRVRYTSAGVAGDWATMNGVYVIGKTTPPPPPTQLWLDGGRVLRWAYGTEPPDLKGFEIRFSYGSSVTWETALHIHDGTLTGRTYTLPDTLRGTVTFEVRAVDVAGNYSATGAKLIKGLGDRPVENILTTLDLRAAGWPGYKKNMEVWRSGTLAATGSSPYMYDADSGAMYDLDDSEPFYQCAFQEAAYTYIFQPGAGEIGATLSFQYNISGGSWRVEYRKCNYLWPDNLDDDLWPTDLSDDFWPDEMSAWLPFHGELVLDDALYEIRIVFEPGTTHGRIEGLTLVFDVPDITEYLEDVVIHPGGTRLPITRQFNAIKAVTLTLQSTADYAGAVAVKVLDRNAAAGPLVKCFNTSGASVKAVIDATITGY